MRPLASEAFPCLCFRSGTSRFIRRKRLSSATSPASIKRLTPTGLAWPTHKGTSAHSARTQLVTAFPSSSPLPPSTYRIVRLPRIESFGFHVSDRSAQHDRRRPPPSNGGPASTPVRNTSEFDAQCGRRGGWNQRHKGTRALIPPSSLRLLAPIDATLRQKPSLLDRFPDTLFCGRSHTRRGQRFINLHNVMISLRNRSPGDDRETSPADRDFLRARQPECAAHPRKRNKEEIRPPIMDRSIVSLFSISFLT